LWKNKNYRQKHIICSSVLVSWCVFSVRLTFCFCLLHTERTWNMKQSVYGLNIGSKIMCWMMLNRVFISVILDLFSSCLFTCKSLTLTTSSPLLSSPPLLLNRVVFMTNWINTCELYTFLIFTNSWRSEIQINRKIALIEKPLNSYASKLIVWKFFQMWSDKWSCINNKNSASVFWIQWMCWVSYFVCRIYSRGESSFQNVYFEAMFSFTETKCEAK